MMLDLRGAKNWDQIVAMVAAAAREAKPGTWILGSGFIKQSGTGRRSRTCADFR